MFPATVSTLKFNPLNTDNGLLFLAESASINRFSWKVSQANTDSSLLNLRAVMDLSFFKVKKVQLTALPQYTGLDNLWSLISDLDINRVNIQRTISIE